MGPKVSPWVAVVVIAIVVLIAGVIFMRGASPERRSAQIDQFVGNTVVGKDKTGKAPAPTAPQKGPQADPRSSPTIPVK